MRTLRFTIKNYRGYSDQRPARFDISPGFTAFVGPNNAGKSSINLLIYELRELFEVLMRPQSTHPNAFSALAHHSIQLNQYPGTSDALELFHYGNNRNLSVEIEILLEEANVSPLHIVNRMVATARRSAPTTWSVDLYSLQRPGERLHGDGGFVAETTTAFRATTGSLSVDFAEFFDAMSVLRDARYYGSFRNALNEGGKSYLDFTVGTAFIELWDRWKTSGNIAQSLAIGRVTDEIRRLFEFRHLEINASNPLKTLLINADNFPYRLNALGSGLAQFIMVLGNAATTKPSLLLIDEPETNLHPALQVDFLLTAAKYARAGCIFSTHSVGLARSVAERIYSVQRTVEGPTVRPFAATASYSEFLGELSFTSFKEMGCEKILLVEGVNDVKAVQQLLRLYRKEHSVVLLPLGGDQLAVGGREQELQELSRLSDQIFVLVDSERHIANAPVPVRRQAFAEACKAIGFSVLVTERRSIENYFSERAVKAALGPGFSALQPFERLADHVSGWSKTDNWKITLHMQKDDLSSTDLGDFLDQL